MPRVTVRLARLDVAAGEVAELATLLTPEERARAARFVQDDHRRRFIVRRARRREWLGAALGGPPQAVPIVTDAAGRPYVPGGDLHFSASHSGELMALATSQVAVGIDLETIRRDFDWRPVADRLFAPEEQEELRQEGRAGFFRCWARKEAFIKALGDGLGRPLDSFAVSCGTPARLLRGGAGWAIASLDLPIAGAVVARDDGAPLTLAVSAAS